MTFSFGGGNKGFSFGTGLGAKKQEEEEKPRFQVTEQMLISELPNDIAKLFIDAFEQIQTTSKELSVNASNVSNATIESDFEQIKKDTIECINGGLTSLAHQIDFGRSSFNECKKDLEVSKSDCNNSNHFRGVPSPFIKRYASRITKHAEELSQKLASYNSRFQPNQQLSGFKEQNESQVLIDLLTEQQKSILRISSRVAAINERLEKIRSIMKTRLKTNISANQVEDIQQVPCAQKVQDEYKRFLSDKKQKRIKIAEETDLFGNSTKVVPKKAGGLFGNSGSNFTFGAKKTTTTTSSTTKK